MILPRAHCSHSSARTALVMQAKVSVFSKVHTDKDVEMKGPICLEFHLSQQEEEVERGREEERRKEGRMGGRKEGG